MISQAASEVVESLLDEESLVLDVGGGRYPYFRANYVLDIREYGHGIGTPAFGKREGAGVYFSEDTWVARDFYRLPWPFDDNQFDFVICMDTLEDLRDPVAVAQELQRVGRAGYISCPTRAFESSKAASQVSGLRRVYGFPHHRWFVEIRDGGLIFKHKHPLLYEDRKARIRKPGQRSLQFFWARTFHCEERYLGSNDQMRADAHNFAQDHRSWLAQPRRDRGARYCAWPREWGPMPAAIVDADRVLAPRWRRELSRLRRRLYSGR